MFPWAAFPFLRYVLWLIVGILAGKFFALNELVMMLTGVLAGAGYGLIYLCRRHIPSFTFWQGFLSFLLLFTLGVLRIEQRQAILDPNFPETGASYWLIETKQEAAFTAKTIKVPVQLVAHRAGGGWKFVNSSLMLYIRKDSLQFIPPSAIDSW